MWVGNNCGGGEFAYFTTYFDIGAAYHAWSAELTFYLRFDDQVRTYLNDVLVHDWFTETHGEHILTIKESGYTVTGYNINDISAATSGSIAFKESGNKLTFEVQNTCGNGYLRFDPNCGGCADFSVIPKW
jgi:hypothetical protein